MTVLAKLCLLSELSFVRAVISVCSAWELTIGILREGGLSMASISLAECCADTPRTMCIAGAVRPVSPRA